MQNADAILVPLANGFEEIEAVTIIDVLRRAELPVVVAGLEPGPVVGAHGIGVGVDRLLEDVEPASLRAIVLPGGMPGTLALLEDERVRTLVKTLHDSGRTVAAICAAPMVLAAVGVLSERPATSHPSVRDRLADARVVDAERVVRSDNVFTSQGPGTALEFSLALVLELAGESVARELAGAMLAETGVTGS